MHRACVFPMVSFLLMPARSFSATLRPQSLNLNPEPSPARILASISTPTRATPPSPFCAKHFPSPATGSALRPEPSETPGSANAPPAIAEIRFPAPLSWPAKRRTQIFVASRQQGTADAANAAATAKGEGFPSTRLFFWISKKVAVCPQVSRLLARLGRCARPRRLSRWCLLLRNARQRR